MRLTNETALVTGGTSGIGKKIAERFLAEGCAVAVCSRTPEKVEKTVAELSKKYGGKIFGMAADVSKIEDMTNLVEKVVEKFGSLRILVACAGVNLKYGPLEYYSPKVAAADAQKIVSINLLGTIHSISAALTQMKKQKYGRIITFSGGGADRPIPNMSFYSMTKGAVVTFSKCFAEELNEGLKDNSHDIRINIYQPGMLKTNLTQHVEVVPNWKSIESVINETNLALEYMGGDIDKSTSKVIPMVMPSCKNNGKIFRGFSLFKLILGAMKLQKVLKSNT
ncbi:MAG: hypothetical protein DRO88_03540 [Promethearchaeia archaeon]|nr:MAG: hypothetical protein DRO88_03540 [Candidatus Lokiarchaeia archaeon]